MKTPPPSSPAPAPWGIFLWVIAAVAAGILLERSSLSGAKNLVAGWREASLARHSAPPYGGAAPMHLPFSAADLRGWQPYAEFNSAALKSNRRLP